jgi:integrase
MLTAIPVIHFEVLPHYSVSRVGSWRGESIRVAGRRSRNLVLYKRDKNIRAIQLLLGHKKIESTVRYLGIDVQDALEASENLDI